MADVPSGLVGQNFPGPNARGISLPGFLKAFPDEASCIEYLFWVRGGHQTPCGECGRQTTWFRPHHHPMYRSRCCYVWLSATKGTLFFRAKSLWEWFYVIILILNLSASPSGAFLARHLGVPTSGGKAWVKLLKIREHMAQICATASRSLRGHTVHVENLRLLHVLSHRSRKTRRVSVLVVSSATDVFAFHLPMRRPDYCQRVLDQLEVAPDLYTFDRDFAALGAGLKNYRVHVITPATEHEDPDVWRCFAKGRSFAVYLVRSFNKRYGFLTRKYLETYLAEFVFRFNFANDKAMLFPLFMSNLPRTG